MSLERRDARNHEIGQSLQMNVPVEQVGGDWRALLRLGKERIRTDQTTQRESSVGNHDFYKKSKGKQSGKGRK